MVSSVSICLAVVARFLRLRAGWYACRRLGVFCASCGSEGSLRSRLLVSPITTFWSGGTTGISETLRDWRPPPGSIDAGTPGSSSPRWGGGRRLHWGCCGREMWPDKLSASVPHPAPGPIATLPQVLSRVEIRALFSSFDQSTAVGRRDLAIATLHHKAMQSLQDGFWCILISEACKPSGITATDRGERPPIMGGSDLLPFNVRTAARGQSSLSQRRFRNRRHTHCFQKLEAGRNHETRTWKPFITGSQNGTRRLLPTRLEESSRRGRHADPTTPTLSER